MFQTWSGTKLFGASLVAQLVKNLPTMQETPVWFLDWEDPLEKGKATHSSIVAWRISWTVFWGFPGGSDSKESAHNVGDLGSIPGLGRSPEGGHGNPLQYSCLENPHGQRSLVGYSPRGHKESDTTEQSSTIMSIEWEDLPQKGFCKYWKHHLFQSNENAHLRIQVLMFWAWILLSHLPDLESQSRYLTSPSILHCDVALITVTTS